MGRAAEGRANARWGSGSGASDVDRAGDSSVPDDGGGIAYIASSSAIRDGEALTPVVADRPPAPSLNGRASSGGRAASSCGEDHTEAHCTRAIPTPPRAFIRSGGRPATPDRPREKPGPQGCASSSLTYPLAPLVARRRRGQGRTRGGLRNTASAWQQLGPDRAGVKIADCALSVQRSRPMFANPRDGHGHT
jgi:hypothetical protein